MCIFRLEDFSKNIFYLTQDRLSIGRIVEYDIKSANISILRQYNKISNEYYVFLSRLPKIEREKEIGIRIRNDSDLYETIKNGIAQAKYQFLKENNINLNQVVRVANDAVFINSTKDLKYTKFGLIEFKQKSINSIFCVLDRALHLLFNSFNDQLNIDIIGIRPEYRSLHSHFITFIGNLFYFLEKGYTEDALIFLQEFYIQYVRKELPIEYYRELNHMSKYRILNSYFCISDFNEDINILDITFNQNIIRELYSMILDILQL